MYRGKFALNDAHCEFADLGSYGSQVQCVGLRRVNILHEAQSVALGNKAPHSEFPAI